MATANFQKDLWNSWRDSLKIFRSKNLKVFALVTINALYRALESLAKTGWPLLIPLLGMGLSFFDISIYSMVGAVFLSYLFLFLFFLGVRPSVYVKNSRYFLSYGLYFPFYFLGIVFAHIRVGLVGDLLCVPLMIFCALFFYFDSDGSIQSMLRSIVNGIKMVFYNYPFWLTSTLLYGIAFILINNVIFKVIFGAFFICWCNNFYIKKVHEQFHLYFNTGARE